ncbi:glutathione S-transferase family protein [Pseudooceanicola sp.]|uniref:glutathione S-transferase family protein n=1 Tax=Pseudooceanicola sp. TaxID=1914328 RepID=UPI00405835CC
MSGVTLHGFRYSVYVRAARMALSERGVAYRLDEVNPFDPDDAGRNPHPMNRVPVLDHGGFRVFETSAILTYVAMAFPGPPLIPTAPPARARMVQAQGITDAYAYWPLVRQVYSAAVFGPALGQPRDEATLARGLSAAAPALYMLEEIAAEGLVLNGADLSLADLHLAPMIAAFTAAHEGYRALAAQPALHRWWQDMVRRDSLAATEPGLPDKATR